MRIVQGDYRKVKEYLKDVMCITCFEFKLPYVDENCVFKEINRFNDESRSLTRFKNKYSGDVAVDVTDWIDKPINEYFEAFAYFLLDRMLEFNDSKVILTCEKECTKEFLLVLEECFNNEVEAIDLGIRGKGAIKRVIGFVSEELQDENKKPYKEAQRYV